MPTDQRPVSHSTRLTAVATRWAEEIGQDYLVVASILLRFARGDYTESPTTASDPNVRLLLSTPESPVTIARAHRLGDTADVPNQLEHSLGVSRPVGAVAEYLVPDIEQLLADFDPPIEHEALASFCVAQQIPLPRFLTPQPPPPPPAAPTTATPPARAIRMAETAQRHAEWQKAYLKLKRKHPGNSDRWIAERIAKLPVAAGCAAGTIRKNMAPKKK